MNPLKVKLVDEKPSHYVMRDGESEFRVAKAGLSEQMHAKIKALGKPVQKHDDGGEVSTPTPATPPMSLPEQFSPAIGAVNPLAGAFTNQVGRAALLSTQPMATPAVAAAGSQLESNADNRDFIASKGISEGRPSAEKDKEKSPAPATAQPPPGAKFQQLGYMPVKYDSSKEDAAEGEAEKQLKIAADETNRAAVAKAAAEQHAAEERVRVHDEAEHRRMQVQAEAQANTQQQMRGVQSAIEDLNRVDTHIDPDHYWATRSTGGKISAILGLALGAAGTGRDGVNHAAQLLNQTIDRDIDAQKTQAELAMRKGQANLEGRKTMYQLMREQGLDAMAATDAAKAGALEGVENKLKASIASTGDATAKANYATMLAQVQQQKAQHASQAAAKALDANKATSEAHDRAQIASIDLYKANIEAGKVGAAGSGVNSPGAITASDIEKYTSDLADKDKPFIERLKGLGNEEDRRTQLAERYLTSQGMRVNDENLKRAKEHIPGGLLDNIKAAAGLGGRLKQRARATEESILAAPKKGVGRDIGIEEP